MRTMAAVLAATGLILSPGLVTPADAAGDEWSFGGVFQVGGVHFRVGWHEAEHHRGLYVRADSTLQGHGHYPLCFADGKHLYHHPTCPFVRRHFRRHDLHPERVLYRHGPTHRASLERAHPGKRAHPGRRAHAGRGRAKGKQFKDRGGSIGYRIPPGHLPPPGTCRIWYPGIPPGHQPPPVECGYAYLYAPYGSFVVPGGR